MKKVVELIVSLWAQAIGGNISGILVGNEVGTSNALEDKAVGVPIAPA